MNFFSITAIALKSLRKKIGTNIILILLLTFLFFMSQLIITTWMGPRIGRLKAESYMNDDFAQWGNMTLEWNQEWNEDLWNFIQELKNTGLVQCIGSFTLMGMEDEGLTELIELQNLTNVKNNTLLNDITLYCYMTDDISLFEKKANINDNIINTYNSKNDILILLGNNYKQIEIGSIYYSSIDRTRRYIVAGYLQLNDYFFSDNIFRNDEMWNAALVNNLDNFVIMIFQDHMIMTANELFYIEEGVSPEKLDIIQDIADSYHIEMSLTKLETIYNRNNESAINESLYALPYFIIVFLSVMIIILSYYLIDVIGNKKKYGIYYILGFKTKDIKWLLLIENSIKIVISFIISVGIFIKFFHFVYPKGYVDEAIEKIICGAAFAGSGFISILFIILCVFIPLHFLKNELPNELIYVSRG